MMMMILMRLLVNVSTAQPKFSASIENYAKENILTIFFDSTT